MPCDIGCNGRFNLQPFSNVPQSDIYPATHFMHSVLLLQRRDMHPFIQYRKQITCQLTMAVILANNRLCLFRQRNIDCSVRFLTVIDQPPIRNVGRGQIGNIHERYATAQVRKHKNIECKLLYLLSLSTISVDNLHHVCLAQRSFRCTGVEFANLVLVEWVFLPADNLCLNCSVEHSP